MGPPLQIFARSKAEFDIGIYAAQSSSSTVGADLTEVTPGGIAFVNARTRWVPVGADAPIYVTGTGPLNDDTAYYLVPGIEPPPPPPPCFREGTKILCLVEGADIYVPVETLRYGTLVKTRLDGYKPVELIGKTTLQNSGTDERIQTRLYKCSPANYPELTEDLYITGCHSILVDSLTDKEEEETIKQMDRVFTYIKMVHFMMGNGKMIYMMVFYPTI
jgi:hypothetical protein